MSDLAKLVVRLEAETARYSAELDRAKKQLAGFEKDSNAAVKKIAKGAGVAALAAATGLAAMVKSSIDAADEMAQLAEKTGITTEVLSGLAYAANLSNVSNEDLAKSLAKLAKTSVDAAQGGKQQVEAFKALGVSVQNADKSMRGTEDIMLDIAQRFSELEDGAAKSALAQDIFGKSGAALIPFLNQGKEGIAALTAEAEKFGIVIGGQTAKEADAFNDNLDRLKAAANGIGVQLASKLLPHLVQLTDSFVELAKDGDKLQTVVDGIVATFKVFATVGLAVNTVFQAIGRSIATLVATFSKLDFDAMDFSSPTAFAIALAKNAKNAGEAWDTFKIGAEDVADSVSKNIDRMTGLWTEQGEKIEEVIVSANKMRETLNYGTKGGGSQVEEIKIIGEKIQDSPMEQFYRELNEKTETQKQKALSSIEEQKAALEELMAARRISETEYAERLEAIKQSENDVLGITERQQQAEERRASAMAEGAAIFEATRTPLEKYNAELTRLDILLKQGAIDQETFNRAAGMAKEDMSKASDSVAAFLDEAKRNSQDILGQGIYDVLKNGADRGSKAALQTFKDMILRMVAEAAAAQVMKALFGGDSSGGASGGGGGGGGGVWGQFAAAAASYFGGSKDSGGRGVQGKAYAIGTGAQPEMFVPDTSGTFLPADQWMGAGGQKVTQNIYVQGRVDQRSARQLELETARRQNAAASRLG